MFWKKSQVDANKKEDLSINLNDLSTDLKTIIFSFLNRNGLHKAGMVCRSFNLLSKKMLSDAPEYYTTGTVIELYHQEGSMLRPQSPEQLKLSTIDSIFKPAQLHLFKTEADALDYARSTRVESDSWMADDIKHSAIFKVRYLANQPDSNWQPITITFFPNSPAQRQVTLNFLEVANKQVHILSGQLKYDMVGSNVSVEKPVIHFANDELVTKDGQPKGCSIS